MMTVIRSSRHALALGVLLLGMGRALPAQGATSIPSPLVTALLGGSMGVDRSTEYYVGTLPPGWPSTLTLDPSLTVVGGLRSRAQLVAVFADSGTRRPLAAVERGLEGAKWMQPTMPISQGFEEPRRGFQSSPSRYGYWCLDSARATARSVAAPAPLAYVLVSYQVMPHGQCMPTDPMERSGARLAFPTLRSPPGVHMRGASGPGGSNDDVEATAWLIDSTSAPVALLAHYVEQLVTAGWTTSAPVSNDATAVQSLEARDTKGDLWRGALIVTSAASTRTVSLRMSRAPQR